MGQRLFSHFAMRQLDGIIAQHQNVEDGMKEGHDYPHLREHFNVASPVELFANIKAFKMLYENDLWLMDDSRQFEMSGIVATGLLKTRPPVFPRLPFNNIFINFPDGVVLMRDKPLPRHDHERELTAVVSATSDGITALKIHPKPKQEAVATYESGRIKYRGLMITQVGYSKGFIAKARGVLPSQVGIRHIGANDIDDEVRIMWVENIEDARKSQYWTGRVVPSTWPELLIDSDCTPAEREWSRALLDLAASILHLITTPGIRLERVDPDEKANRQRKNRGDRLVKPYHRILIPGQLYVGKEYRHHTETKHGIRYDVTGHLKWFGYCHFCDSVNKKRGDADCWRCGKAQPEGSWLLKSRWCPDHQRGVSNEVYVPALRVVREVSVDEST